VGSSNALQQVQRLPFPSKKGSALLERRSKKWGGRKRVQEEIHPEGAWRLELDSRSEHSWGRKSSLEAQREGGGGNFVAMELVASSSGKESCVRILKANVGGKIWRPDLSRTSKNVATVSWVESGVTRGQCRDLIREDPRFLEVNLSVARV